jgi:Ser/Thr protein kinase RdoA (MazF antagonist)
VVPQSARMQGARRVESAIYRASIRNPPWQSPTDRVSSAEVARLVRQFHDLTAGTPLAGDQEVVCHNDLSPKNTVYRDDREGMRPGNGLSVLLRWSS